MATLESEKLITEKFIENVKNDENTDGVQEEAKSESNKLILDEISNEKSAKIEENPPNVNNSKADSLPESCPIKPQEVEVDIIENISDETESSRDLKTSESQEQVEQHEVENEIEDESEKSVTDQPDDEVEPKEEWQDILGSGVIMKKILKEGIPDSRPHRSDKCFINFTCRLEDADEETYADKGKNYELGLGEGDVVQGLDVALGLMNKNERCLLKIGSRLAFGTRGLLPRIPPDATVLFDVELVEVLGEDDCETLSVRERRRQGNKKRERGNWWYLRGENTMAIQCYRKALDFLDEVESENSEEKPSDSELQQLLEDRLKVLNNMASAQIKMELYDQAQVSLQSVLKCQPDNVKALFRKAKIFIARNELAQALKLLEKAKSLEPDDFLIAKEIIAVNNTINKQKNSEREYARRMFGAPSTPGSSGNSNVRSDKRKSSSKFQVLATLGATLIVGLAGVAAYKLKYP